jgi:hypothetical protein
VTYVWNIQASLIGTDEWDIYYEDEDLWAKDVAVKEVRVLQQMNPSLEFRLVRRLVPEWEVVSLDSEE